MIIRIITESKIRDRLIISFTEEYVKRLTGHVLLEIKEFDSLNKSYAKFILSLKSNDILIGLDGCGKKYDSRSFADYIATLRDQSARSINFVIGAAEGLSGIARDRAYSYLSLSDMTLSYRVAVVVLTEQIYRAMMIIDGHPYHK